MWTIAKTFKFSASHQLSGLPDNHQCVLASPVQSL